MIKKILKYILNSIILPFIVLFIISKFVFEFKLELAMLGSIVLILFINVVIYSFIFPILIWKKIAKKTIKYEKLTKEDILKNNELYREILENNSPGVLSYIDNMNFKFESIAVSSLLYLKYKKQVDFDNNRIIKLDNSNNIQLNNTENYILNSISNGKIYISKNTLQNNLLKDALKEGLIEANYNIEKSLGKKILILFGLFIFILMLFIFIDNIFTSLIGILLFITLITFPTGSIIYVITYYNKRRNNPLFRTKKGNEINKKLEGLKNYIREYSLLKEKDDDSIELWEDYLIYSVIFEQNNKIQKKYLQYITLE